jgi:single-stranded-DNA-specific exonuclease
VLAFYGLKKLAVNPRPGVLALMKIAGINPNEISIMRIVFGLAPRINAAGRLEDARYAVRMMLSADGTPAQELAQRLDVHNTDRRELDQQTTSEAIKMIEEKFSESSSTVLYHQDWHKGIIGIVASRCIESYYRPTIIFTRTSKNLLAGSARSVDGFDVYRALEECSEHLVQFGGHKYAAGMTMKPDSLSDFREHFEQVVKDSLQPEQRIASLKVDAHVELGDLDNKFYRILQQMAPFGPGNEQPVFGASHLTAENIKEFSSRKNPDSSHLKFTCHQGGRKWECIGFNLGHLEPELRRHATDFHMAFNLTENNYRGNSTLQLQVKDIKWE